MSGSIVLVLRLITAIALFAFVGWALYSLYRETRRQGLILANRRVPGISLAIKDSEGDSLRYFSQPEISLGRDPSCDISTKDDTTSARHAQFVYHHGQWWLEDLASTNGTFLNNTQILMPTVLTSGDEIKCGNTHIVVSLSENIIIDPTLPLKKQG